MVRASGSVVVVLVAQAEERIERIGLRRRDRVSIIRPVSPRPPAQVPPTYRAVPRYGTAWIGVLVTERQVRQMVTMAPRPLPRPAFSVTSPGIEC